MPSRYTLCPLLRNPGSAVRGHTAEIADVKVQVAGLSTMEIGLATSEVW